MVARASPVPPPSLSLAASILAALAYIKLSQVFGVIYPEPIGSVSTSRFSIPEKFSRASTVIGLFSTRLSLSLAAIYSLYISSFTSPLSCGFSEVSTIYFALSFGFSFWYSFIKVGSSSAFSSGAGGGGAGGFGFSTSSIFSGELGVAGTSS